MLRLVSSFTLLASAHALSAQTFAPPSRGPLVQTVNDTTRSNASLHDKVVVKGKAFNRIIQTAASTPIFESLAEQGILFTNYKAVTSPSPTVRPSLPFPPVPSLRNPFYDTYLSLRSDVAAIGGDFFGKHDDNMYHIPPNIGTVVDLLEAKRVSWTTYQENMPADAFHGFRRCITSAVISYTSPTRRQDPKRAPRIRTFTDFANDVVNGTIPQWVFVTPNMVNDAHDTTIDFAASFLEYWLFLLTDPRVNDAETLILLTFDENESYGIQNGVWSLGLGGAIPLALRGTTDDTLYTHYSTLSTVQANWGLGSLGRQDPNACVFH
ncbi:phosphoesterase family-domain-containing protein [Mycena epipterygia]|nr:phosphoesterase family-domain-containing protein [Mycena epipterygia]